MTLDRLLEPGDRLVITTLMQAMIGNENQRGIPIIPADTRNNILVNRAKPSGFCQL